MPIVIKNVDEIVYSRFKAKAAEKGLRVGEAITEAMKIWIEQTKAEDVYQIMEDRNEAAFRRIFPDLLKHHIGKWCIISNGDLIGVYESKTECFKAVKKEGLLISPNLVFPVQKIEPRHILLRPYRRITNAPSL